MNDRAVGWLAPPRRRPFLCMAHDLTFPPIFPHPSCLPAFLCTPALGCRSRGSVCGAKSAVCMLEVSVMYNVLRFYILKLMVSYNLARGMNGMGACGPPRPGAGAGRPGGRADYMYRDRLNTGRGRPEERGN